MLGAAGEKAAQRREKFRLVEQEGVVAPVPAISTKLTLAAGGVEGMDDLLVSDRGNSQSLVKETMQNRVLRAAEGIGQRRRRNRPRDRNNPSRA